MISVLCVQPKSNYYLIENLDLWDKERDAYNFKGTNPVITHAPCQQWSKLRGLAKNNPYEKELAFFCLEQVQKNGGIFEHPVGSNFFDKAGISRTKLISVNQHWFGFPAKKNTLLYFNQFKPLATPLNFDAITHVVSTSRRKPGFKPKKELSKSMRSKMPLSFCQYLVNCINQQT